MKIDNGITSSSSTVSVSKSTSNSSMTIIILSLLGCALPEVDDDDDDQDDEEPTEHTYNDDEDDYSNYSSDHHEDNDQTHEEQSSSLFHSLLLSKSHHHQQQQQQHRRPRTNRNKKSVRFVPVGDNVWYDNTLYYNRHNYDCKALWYDAVDYHVFRKQQSYLIRDIRASGGNAGMLGMDNNKENHNGNSHTIFCNNNKNHHRNNNQLLLNQYILSSVHTAPVQAYNDCCVAAGPWGRQQGQEPKRTNHNPQNVILRMIRGDDEQRQPLPSTTMSRTQDLTLERFAQWLDVNSDSHHHHHHHFDDKRIDGSGIGESCRFGLERLGFKEIRQDILRRRQMLLQTIQGLQQERQQQEEDSDCDDDESDDGCDDNYLDHTFFLRSRDEKKTKTRRGSGHRQFIDDDDDAQRDKYEKRLRRACESLTRPSVRFAIQVARAQACACQDLI